MFFPKKVWKPASFSVLLAMLSWNGASAAPEPTLSTDYHTSLRRSSSEDASSVVVVKGFLLTGNTLVSNSELQALLVGYLDRSCDLPNLREAANRVTGEYHRRGHTFAKAYILPQHIQDGVVNITVVEGRIGRIVIEGNRNYASSFIRSYLTSGKPVSSLTIPRLEKALLILNSRFTDLKVSANFTPGQESGTTDLYVKVEDSFPLHATLSANNFGSDFVSRYRFGGQLEWTNALIPGSLATLGGFIGERASQMNIVNGGYSFPLGSGGTMVGLSLLNGYFDIGKDFADLGIHNRETSGELFVTHPFILNRRSTLSGKVGFRASDAKYYLIDALSAHDNIRVLHADVEGDMLSWGGKTFGSIGISHGLGGFLGGMKADDPLASRKNADNSFTHVNLGLARLQPISDNFSALVRVSGQWSDRNLVAGEEWLIGGINSVHGYSSGEGSGDQGYSASIALRATPLANKEILQLSAFLDHGYAHKKSPMIGSQATTVLNGAGVGVFSHLVTLAPTDLRFDIGWPLHPSSNFLSESPVIYFETSIRF